MDTINKIAFCFLTYDIIVRYDIWNKFFENIDFNKYIVYIHPKLLQKNINLYTFNYKVVENITHTNSKYDISIVNATIKLLEDTYQYSNNISHFIFLSQSCIPLYNFEKIYSIVNTLPLSVISSINQNKKERYININNNMKKYISYSNFTKQQPNMILIKNDVDVLIKNKHLTNYFSEMECPDEHYFINILLYFFKKNILKNQITFCNYNLTRTQALEFNNINNYFIDNIRKYGFLFMRKVILTSNIDIEYLLKN
jgi:hypothetical protein